MVRSVLKQWPLGALLVAAGCQVIGGYEEFTEGGDSTTAVHPCDGMPKVRDRGTLGVQVLIAARDDHCFWIDQTEVTVAQYDAFLGERSGDPWNGWDSVACAWKLSDAGGAELSRPNHDLDDACAIDAHGDDPNPFSLQKPMRCVDWCDARAYCQWAGGDLCNVHLVSSEYDSPGPDQWTVACSPTSAYPYGPTVERRVCNIGLQSGECGILTLTAACNVSNAKNFRDCTYPDGPFDMVGNVSEWVLPCTRESGRLAHCVYRGGSYADDDMAISCNEPSRLAARRDQRSKTRGFRCCTPIQ